MNIAKQTIRLYWQHLRKHKVVLWLSIIFAGGGVLVGQFLVPLVVAQSVDKLVALQGQSFSIASQFGLLLAALAGLLIAEIILWRIQTYILWGMETNIMKELSERCFAVLIRKDHKFHTNRFGGSLVSQTNKFVSAFERLMDEFVYNGVTLVVAFAATIIILWPKSPQFVVVFMAVSLIFIVVMYLRTKIEYPFSVREAAAETKQTGQLADAITNIGTIKPFAQESLEDRLFSNKTQDVKLKSLATRRIALVNDTISNGFTSVLYFLAIFFSIIAVVTFGASIGTVLLINSYGSNLLRRLWELRRVMKNITRSFGDAHDMTEILGSEPEIKDISHPEKLSVVRGDIQLRDIVYTYPEQPDNPLFKGLSVHIKPGEKVGLVGHSGGGKTTITKLILRLMDVDSGTIHIDGRDISQVTQHDLRASIAYVPQEPLMFHRSIADNIRYGRLGASQQEIEAVAKMAHAHEFIINLPKGYETLVGERGTKLSGGQRQRVAIARAMLKNAPILLLDEATSALDSDSEQLIQAALWKLMEGKTAIVIAHRLSTIQRMDRILVLEEGAIVEQGTHKELTRRGGIYAELWAHQSGGFLNEDE